MTPQHRFMLSGFWGLAGFSAVRSRKQQCQLGESPGRAHRWRRRFQAYRAVWGTSFLVTQWTADSASLLVWVPSPSVPSSLAAGFAEREAKKETESTSPLWTRHKSDISWPSPHSAVRDQSGCDPCSQVSEQSEEVRTWRLGSPGLSQRLPVRLYRMSLALYLVPFGELLGGRFACGSWQYFLVWSCSVCIEGFSLPFRLHPVCILLIFPPSGLREVLDVPIFTLYIYISASSWEDKI